MPVNHYREAPEQARPATRRMCRGLRFKRDRLSEGKKNREKRLRETLRASVRGSVGQAGC